MKLFSLEKREHPEGLALSAIIAGAGRPDFKLWFQIHGTPSSWVVDDRYDAFVVAVYLAAMRLKEDLYVEGMVSETLLKNIQGPVSQLWQSWFPGAMKHTAVLTQGAASPQSSGNSTGLFFSGGVDSFYTLLKNRHRNDPDDFITYLVTVQGFDVPLSHDPFFLEIAERHQKVSRDFNSNLVTVRTNLREFSDAFLDWEFYHGSAMAAVGLSMGRGFRRFYIASATGSQKRWGSKPELDRLWNNGSVEFIHDETGVPRLNKLRLVAGDSRALKQLRVCWENTVSGYNCSACEKCLRTMVALEILDARAAATTFEWRHLARNMLRLVAEPRTFHHWRSLRKAYAWSIGGIGRKLLVSLMLLHSSIRGKIRQIRRSSGLSRKEPLGCQIS